VLNVLVFGVALTLGIELLCCLFRFVFRMRSREIQARWLGVRIHHGYTGVALFPALFFLPSMWAAWIGAVAVALVLSDLLHHFVVLPLATGQRD
jgi:hypothetical protein